MQSPTTFVTTGHKQILGLNSTNESGGSPAHILDTSVLSGYDKSLLELRNGGNSKFRVDSEGNIHSNSIVLGGNFIWVDASGKLRIKNGTPNSDLDGVVVGSQS